MTRPFWMREYETDVICDLGGRRDEAVGAEMFRQTKNVALGVGERVEPAAATVNDDDNSAGVPAIFDRAPRTLAVPCEGLQSETRAKSAM